MTTAAVLPSCPFSSTCVTPGISRHTHPEGNLVCPYYIMLHGSGGGGDDGDDDVKRDL